MNLFLQHGIKCVHAVSVLLYHSNIYSFYKLDFAFHLVLLASFLNRSFVLGGQVCSFVFTPIWQSFVHSTRLTFTYVIRIFILALPFMFRECLFLANSFSEMLTAPLTFHCCFPRSVLEVDIAGCHNDRGSLVAFNGQGPGTS